MKKDPRADLIKEADRLRPLVEMVEGKGFKGWRTHIERELEMLEEFSWNSSAMAGPIKVSKAFSELGLTLPTTTQELHECWLSFRAVRNYTRAKFKWLDTQVRLAGMVQEQLSKLK